MIEHVKALNHLLDDEETRRSFRANEARIDSEWGRTLDAQEDQRKRDEHAANIAALAYAIEVTKKAEAFIDACDRDRALLNRMTYTEEELFKALVALVKGDAT